MDWFAPYKPMPVDDLPAPPREDLFVAAEPFALEDRAEMHGTDVDHVAGLCPVCMLRGELATRSA